jgi:hypothetical protein
MGEAETIQDEGPTKGREQFRKYEYTPCTRTLTTSNTKISEWLEHPNPNYRRDIYRTRCQHGIRCKGTKALTTTKPFLALHPFEWEMFPDEYIRYIISLPMEPLENINETTLPKWSILPTLNRDTTPIMTGCKFGKYCRIGPQCRYLHPQMETYNLIQGQVTNILNNNVKLYNDTIEKKKIRRIPSPPYKRHSRDKTIQGQTSNRSGTTSLKRQRLNRFQYQEYDHHRPRLRGDNEDSPRLYRSRKKSRSGSRSRKRSRSQQRHKEIPQDIGDVNEERPERGGAIAKNLQTG